MSSVDASASVSARLLSQVLKDFDETSGMYDHDRRLRMLSAFTVPLNDIYLKIKTSRHLRNKDKCLNYLFLGDEKFKQL